MYDKNNIFAKIIRKEIPCKLVYEDNEVMAFHDISGSAPVHVLVVPKGEYISFDDFSAIAKPEEIGGFFAKVGKIARDLAIAKTGYRIVMNHGSDASQTVAHFHVHILGGKKLGGLHGGDNLDR